MRLIAFCGALLVSLAWTASLSALPDEDQALTAQVFVLVPLLRSNSVDEKRQAMSELRELAARKSDAPFAFELAEQHVMDALRVSLITPGPEAARLAVEQVLLLGEIGSENCLPLLVSNLSFRGFTTEDRGIKDSPVYTALLRLGHPAVDALFRQALSGDDPDVLAVLADLLLMHFGQHGAVEWIERNVSGLDKSQRDRLATVRHIIEVTTGSGLG